MRNFNRPPSALSIPSSPSTWIHSFGEALSSSAASFSRRTKGRRISETIVVSRPRNGAVQRNRSTGFTDQLIFKWPFGNDGDLPPQLRAFTYLCVVREEEEEEGVAWDKASSYAACSLALNSPIWFVCTRSWLLTGVAISYEILNETWKIAGWIYYSLVTKYETKICGHNFGRDICMKLFFVKKKKKKTFIANGLLSWLFVENFQNLQSISFYERSVRLFPRGIIVNVIRLIS